MTHPIEQEEEIRQTLNHLGYPPEEREEICGVAKESLTRVFNAALEMADKAVEGIVDNDEREEGGICYPCKDEVREALKKLKIQ